MLNITPIPAFNDNYLWLIHNQSKAIVVDPGDPKVVLNYLQKHSLTLEAILITHHHADHTGGINQLKNAYSCTVYGPKNDPVSNLDYQLDHGETINFKDFNLTFNIIAVPGHTLGHISYYAEQSNIGKPLLFCGDTLFSGGCGRLFEGTPSQMLSSLNRLQNLPDNTLVFPAHEYTLSNLKFAKAVEPNNLALNDYIQQVQSLREQHQPSLPSNIALENQINPFLRSHLPSIKQSAETFAQQSLSDDVAVFTQIRHWKDQF